MDFEEKYYNLLVEYRRIIQENKYLKDMMSINKKQDLKKYFIKELMRRK